jgi:chemotaxis protein CheD
VGIVAWDPAARVAGLLHLMLPESKLDPAEAERNPFKYADTGIPALFEAVTKLGADQRRLELWMAGGAQLLDDQKVFNIGQRNVLAAKKLLWKLGGLVRGEDTGGVNSRTLRLDLSTGQVWIRRPGEPDVLMKTTNKGR